jgi:folate-binding protein YgfZ
MARLKNSFGRDDENRRPILQDMSQIAAPESEYEAVLSGCGVLDASERGKLALTGTGAKEFLQGQVSNDVESLSTGRGCYAALLTPKGKMLGDLRILDTGTELLLDTERVALQELFNTIRRFSIGYDVVLHKRTLERGLLTLIGPDADRLSGAGAAGIADEEQAHGPVDVDGIAARAIRTAMGVDLLCEAADTERLRDALLTAGAAAIALPTYECRRIERGIPRYGADLDDSVIPQEAGLNDRAVSFTKGCYVGQETVARLFYRGKPNRHLRGLRLSAPAAPGDVLRTAEREAGRVTSVSISPRLGPIALGFVRREVAPGESVSVGDQATAAEVVELPLAP